MRPAVLNNYEYPNSIVIDRFLHLDGFFYLNYDCIFTENHIIKPLEYYDLVEFLDDGGIVQRNVKFWTAVLKHDVLKVICFEPKTKRVWHRCHRVDDDSLPCDWLLIEKNYFKDDLLEFDF